MKGLLVDMIRKDFLATAAGVAATLGAAAAAFGANGIPTAVYTPAPGTSPGPYWRRGQHGSDRNLRFIFRHVERVIDMLQHDQHDYCGHRVRAIGFLQQAREELRAALQCDQRT
jgi:hypothetical protein